MDLHLSWYYYYNDYLSFVHWTFWSIVEKHNMQQFLWIFFTHHFPLIQFYHEITTPVKPGCQQLPSRQWLNSWCSKGRFSLLYFIEMLPGSWYRSAYVKRLLWTCRLLLLLLLLLLIVSLSCGATHIPLTNMSVCMVKKEAIFLALVDCTSDMYEKQTMRSEAELIVCIVKYWKVDLCHFSVLLLTLVKGACVCVVLLCARTHDCSHCLRLCVCVCDPYHCSSLCPACLLCADIWCRRGCLSAP